MRHCSGSGCSIPSWGMSNDHSDKWGAEGSRHLAAGGQEPLIQVMGAGMGAAEQPLMGMSSPFAAQWQRAAAQVLFHQAQALPQPRGLPVPRLFPWGPGLLLWAAQQGPGTNPKRSHPVCPPRTPAISLIDCRKQFTKYKPLPVPGSAGPGTA